MSKVSGSRRGDAAIPEADPSETVVTDTIDQRRTGRARVQIPLFVQGNAPGTDAGFFEEARTIEINAHGALLSMKNAVTPGQRLTLTNSTNRRTQECTVTAVSAKEGGDVEAAVAFSAPAPKFWRPRRHPELSAFSLLD
jgi:hypothetical protein